jgi:hypothetical protein
MTNRVTVKDRLPDYKRSLYNVLDTAIAETAKDILIVSRNRAPYDKGALRRESEVKQIVPMQYRVSYFVEYARFQEFGGDATRRVRNYTTSGTGAHYLQKTGDEKVAALRMAFVKHSTRASA